MAIAYDAFSSATAGTGDLTWTHTPVGTPKGIWVGISQTTSTTDQVSGVTYGGVAMTETSSSPMTHSTGEVIVNYSYFLGSGIPGGAQTVTVTVTGASTKQAGAISLTASNDTQVQAVNTSINTDTGDSPSATISLSGNTCFVCEVFGTGIANTANFSPKTGWTSRLEHDFGSQCAGWYTYDTVGSSDVTSVGYDQTDAPDDACVYAIAIKESAVTSRVKDVITSNISPGPRT